MDGVRELYAGRSGRRRLLVDGLLLAVVTAAAIIEDRSALLWWVIAASTVVTAAILVVGRMHPLVAMSASAAFSLAYALWQAVHHGPFLQSYLLITVVTSCLAGRRLAATGPALRSFAAITVAAVALTVVVGVATGAPTMVTTGGLPGWVSALTIVAFLLVVPWLAGRYRRLQTELATAGWERARQLELQQWMIADRERLAERTRIADDVHDSLGHELSLIALRAAALEVADLPEHHRAAATQLRTAAASATEQLRTVIGMLRENADHAPLQPVRESIAEPVERARSAGMDIQLELVGQAPGIAPLTGIAIGRVVQEALTNAAKHAPGTTVVVRVEHTSAETLVTVHNNLSTGEPAVGNGRGLIGLAERVRLAGGMLRAGPLGPVFEVSARLPYEPGKVSALAHEPPPPTEVTRLQMRQQLVRTVGTSVAITAAAVILVLGGYLVISYDSVLPSERYAQLAVGQSQRTATDSLPWMQMVDWPVKGPPFDHPGWDCRYYRTSFELAAVHTAYRLCFDRDRLVGKGVVSRTTGKESTAK
ncbi:sensor histidine kinase [Fodinicola feengrottensis]